MLAQTQIYRHSGLNTVALVNRIQWLIKPGQKKLEQFC